MKKEVPTLTGIIIILIAVVIFFGGAFTYSYFAIKQANFTIISSSLSTQQILIKTFPLAGETTDQTAEWKTYQGKPFEIDRSGYEIKIPQSWTIGDESGNKVYIMEFTASNGD